MKKTNFTITFENEDEKNLIKLLVLGSIFFTFLPALIAYFAIPEKFSKESKKLIITLLNFEIIILFADLICVMMPFIFGMLTGIITLAVWIFNLIICLQILSSITNNSPIEIPDFFQFLKAEE